MYQLLEIVMELRFNSSIIRTVFVILSIPNYTEQHPLFKTPMNFTAQLKNCTKCATNLSHISNLQNMNSSNPSVYF
jgi:hypothetical protein